jgi:class 3 adenylate cyclase/pSer/pThr/pTyr-binding forkhead associated (FHA) protein
VPYLIYNPETPSEKTYELVFGTNTLGREWDNTIFLQDGSLSRRHAEITIGYNHVAITDLHSLNGTFVNEVKIDRCELKDGDWIRCGSVVFKFALQLRNFRQESLASRDSQISIVKQVSPEPHQTVMQNLLDQHGTDHSVLRIRQKDTNQRAVDKLKILLEVSKQLSTPEKSDQLLEKILDLLLTIMDVDRAAILLLNQATGQLEHKVVKSRLGIPNDYQFYSKRIIDLVCTNGEALLTTDASIDERLNNSESILRQAIHASMCVPLKPRDQVIGVLYVDNLSMSNIYSDEDVKFLTALANQAAIAIDNSQLYKKMEEEAVIRDKLERFFPEAVSRKLREEGNLEIVETEVTALFVDISGFTKMSSTMQPRQVIEMLNEYFKVMVEEIVFPYEGTLEKYIGDALLAVWGAPYQKENDAQQAVLAAIEMQRAVCRLNQEWLQRGKKPIQIHIGINTGKVAAGNIGSEKLIQYASIGDTMNVTSRICSAAQAEEIFISQSTFDQIRGWNLPFEKLDPVWVKGKEQPLQLYRLLWQQLPSVATSPSL